MHLEMAIGCLMKRQYREVLGWCQVKGLFHTPHIQFKTKGIGFTCHYQKDICVIDFCLFQILGGGFERKLLLIVQI